MARNRRGGLRPPELRGTLGTLLRTAFEQAGGVREALEGVARTGRERLDELREGRQRTDLLVELGEIVLDLVRRGEIDPAELPEARGVLRALDELDDDDPPHPRERARFDDRGRGGRPAPGGRPGARAPRAPERDRGDDDGTVSSGARWAGGDRGRGGAKPPPRVWRPPGLEPRDDDPPPAEAASRLPKVPKPPPNPHKKGGISFEDDGDDDLAAYMHPDDVPPRPARPGDPDPDDRGDS